MTNGFHVPINEAHCSALCPRKATTVVSSGPLVLSSPLACPLLFHLTVAVELRQRQRVARFLECLLASAEKRRPPRVPPRKGSGPPRSPSSPAYPPTGETRHSDFLH